VKFLEEEVKLFEGKWNFLTKLNKE
jgi:hypothetical protein